MLYLIAIFIPPLAVLFTGRPVQSVLNLLLCLLFYFPGLIHAILVVADHKSNVRNKSLVSALRNR